MQRYVKGCTLGCNILLVNFCMKHYMLDDFISRRYFMARVNYFHTLHANNNRYVQLSGYHLKIFIYLFVLFLFLLKFFNNQA
jgi:hypothetical protein